jgi:hypothetical protein
MSTPARCSVLIVTVRDRHGEIRQYHLSSGLWTYYNLVQGRRNKLRLFGLFSLLIISYIFFRFYDVFNLRETEQDVAIRTIFAINNLIYLLQFLLCFYFLYRKGNKTRSKMLKPHARENESKDSLVEDPSSKLETKRAEVIGALDTIELGSEKISLDCPQNSIPEDVTQDTSGVIETFHSDSTLPPPLPYYVRRSNFEPESIHNIGRTRSLVINPPSPKTLLLSENQTRSMPNMYNPRSQHNRIIGSIMDFNGAAQGRRKVHVDDFEAILEEF